MPRQALLGRKQVIMLKTSVTDSEKHKFVVTALICLLHPIPIVRTTDKAMNGQLYVPHQAFNRYLWSVLVQLTRGTQRSSEPWAWKSEKWGETGFKIKGVLYWSKKSKQRLFAHKPALSLFQEFPAPHLVLKCYAYGSASDRSGAAEGSGSCLLRRLKHEELIFAGFKVMLLENSAELVCTVWLGVTPWLWLSLRNGVHCSFGSSGSRKKAQNSYEVVILLLWQGPCLKSELSKTAETQFRSSPQL